LSQPVNPNRGLSVAVSKVIHPGKRICLKVFLVT
jgi:hypothetical protein